MLKEIVKSSPVKNVDVAKYMGMLPQALSRVLACRVYMDKEYYDKLYQYIGNRGGTIPCRNGVCCYPSGKAKGAWDIYIDDEFAATLKFVNLYDLFNFLNEKDLRLHVVKNLLSLANDTTFDNKVVATGKKIKGRDY